MMKKKAPSRSKSSKAKSKPKPMLKESKVETVLVTGASGSVGHLLTAALVEGGRRVVASDLPGSALPEGEGGKIIHRPGDLTSPSFAEEAVKGVDHVVHAAAIIDIGLPYEKLKAVNVDATRALYAAARKNGVKRFVFFSSGSAYKEKRNGVFSEDCRLGAGNDYERTKLECEGFLREQSAGGPPAVTFIRPSLIYGPRGKFLAATYMVIPPIFRLMMPKLPVLKGGPRSNYVHAEDVARAVAFIIGHPGTAGEAFNVADDLPASVGEILEFVGDAYGYEKGITIPYPTALLRQMSPLLKLNPLPFEILTRLLQMAWRLICRRHGLKSPIKPKVDRETLAYAIEDTIFDNTKLTRLGFQYKYPSSRVGILRTIQWYQDAGWVPREK